MSRILGSQTLKRLLELAPEDHYKHKSMTKEEWVHLLGLCPQTFWMHSGDPKHPHAELTSGKCSNGFVNLLSALSFPQLADLCASQVAIEINRKRGGGEAIDWVIGSSYASITFAQRLAARLGGGARSAFTEKEATGQVWRRFKIESGEKVLIAEELISTAKTVAQVMSSILVGNGDEEGERRWNFTPMIANIVHRSPGNYVIRGLEVCHAVHFDIEQWEPSECPLCAGGSKRLKPKFHWTELTKPD